MDQYLTELTNDINCIDGTAEYLKQSINSLLFSMEDHPDQKRLMEQSKIIVTQCGTPYQTLETMSKWLNLLLRIKLGDSGKITNRYKKVAPGMFPRGVSN
jgi:hypothetical protein